MDKIELIFNMYKDSVVVSKPFKMEIAKKYMLSDDEIRNLYVRIQNYQIENFGEKLSYQERAFTAQEKQIVNRRAVQRKYERKAVRRKNNLLDNHFGNVMEQVDDLYNQAAKLSH